MTMGAWLDDAFSLSQQATVPVFQNRLHTKTVRDNVHGSIYLDPLSLRFIDTEQFQRLRDVKQLGMCSLVYPGAVHSRFEHSLGVYWLAGEAIQRLKQYQGRELDIDRFDISCVKLAGLLHDVGHGPFSHVFDGGFIPRVLPDIKWSHEQMSVKMVDYIVDEHHIDIDPDCIRKVKALGEKQFLFDIVANGRNSIDVDKFDYIERDCRGCGLRSSFQFDRLMESMRVMGGEICYRAKEYLNVHKLFETRADLFRGVYLHPKVKALELMLVDALILANGYLEISSLIHDPADYWKLDDSILKTIETASVKELKESQALILRMRRRDLYRFCNEYSVPADQLEHFKEVTPQDIICSQKTSGICLREEDIAISNIKIDLTRGRENPLDSVHFFNDYESDQKLTIPKERISHLLPASYQDRIVRVYSKNPDLVEEISEAFENFQLRTYGIKPQVHGTPDSKKRKRYYSQ
ncbi:uncharacterized protein LOC131041362 isoform X2 [Cryptomeria japonica]|uniref:uncharacterized protein LOC131041362 isoform X2 n=1 Tax=Cryptomeria japonica TaxID=3369 RepID=UPI0025AD58B6|nr:uncharacterized protein LOC131041362 isoform X2 [Cryptomeria japonica]